MTKLNSATNYPSSSIILPAITRLKEILFLYETEHKETKFLETTARLKGNDHDDRSQPYFSNTILLAATLLDPRYKNFKFFRDSNKRDSQLFKAISYIKTMS